MWAWFHQWMQLPKLIELYTVNTRHFYGSVIPQCGHSLSPVQLFAAPWTIAHQVPLAMEFSRQNTGAGCHFLLQGIFPPQGSKPPLLHLLHWLVGSLPAAPPGKPKYLNKAVKNNLFIRINRECQIVSIICRNKCSEAHPKYRCVCL